MTRIRLKGEALSALRRASMTRDGWKCTECGRNVSDNVPDYSPLKAHMAHIVGRGRGGSDTLKNVRTLCLTCHLVEEHSGGKTVKRKV